MSQKELIKGFLHKKKGLDLFQKCLEEVLSQDLNYKENAIKKARTAIKNGNYEELYDVFCYLDNLNKDVESLLNPKHDFCVVAELMEMGEIFLRERNDVFSNLYQQRKYLNSLDAEYHLGEELADSLNYSQYDVQEFVRRIDWVKGSNKHLLGPYVSALVNKIIMANDFFVFDIKTNIDYIGTNHPRGFLTLNVSGWGEADRIGWNMQSGSILLKILPSKEVNLRKEQIFEYTPSSDRNSLWPIRRRKK